MRETFSGLGDLLGYYQFIKLQTEGMKTILPSKDFEQDFHSNPIRNIQTKEDKLCFIGDIEKFIDIYYKQQPGYTLIPITHVKTLFHYALCQHLSQFHSLGELTRHFRKIIKKDRIPYRLTYRQHLATLCDGMRDRAEIYFISKGYLTEEVSNVSSNN